MNALLGDGRLAQALAAAMRNAPADGVAISYSGGLRHLVRFGGNQIHQALIDPSARVTVRAHVGQSLGQASVGTCDPEALHWAVEAACESARFAHPEPSFSGFAKPSPPKAMSAASFDEETAALTSLAKADVLRECFSRASARHATLSGRYHTEALEHAVVNSEGVAAYHAGTRADVAFYASAGDGGGGYAGRLARSANRIPLRDLADAALETAIRSRNPQPLEPGAYDVVLEPAAVAELLDWLAQVCLTARSVEDGSSFAADGLGRSVTGPSVTLYDEGESDLPDSVPMPFDIEGTPKRRLTLIERGIVRGVAHDQLTAARARVEPTGHALEDPLTGERSPAPMHLYFEAGDTPRAAMLDGIERGILVTRFHYVCGTLDPRRASMTGMTRDGTFLIEKGRISTPVVNLRWAESVLDAWRRIDAVSRERIALPGSFSSAGQSLVPAMRVRAWTFVSSQEASS